ncbi:hypothetical protein I3843_02G024100 [Carya illinoinensis]|uniref:glutathione transferase n=1 Tax=Carya illinoinensis TaxID=32201 RepID=A0A922JYZ5_CARIL|nr:hypothetical protein I3760_02G031000 [Carya illinoinensis]KAG6725390.1 hypothetical protein I3842_02G030600 [Carya illinoinensis]KAG7990406.1 hypothetical protein I3843_02G024100 [Carya illinoinensis]
MAEVKLFRTWSSAFALRIVWALEVKGIEYDMIYEDLSNKSSMLLQYNPVYKKVPVLLHKGKPISESFVILEYIEETWTSKTPSLLPGDPYQRAMARFWAKFGDDKILPLIWEAFIKQGKDQEEALIAAHENLKYLEVELRGKKFLGGETVGFADLTFGWLANLVSVFEEVAGVTLIDHEKFPLLLTWMKNFMDAPKIRETWPPRDKLINKYRALRETLIAKEPK